MSDRDRIRRVTPTESRRERAWSPHRSAGDRDGECARARLRAGAVACVEERRQLPQRCIGGQPGEVPRPFLALYRLSLMRSVAHLFHRQHDSAENEQSHPRPSPRRRRPARRCAKPVPAPRYRRQRRSVEPASASGSARRTVAASVSASRSTAPIAAKPDAMSSTTAATGAGDRHRPDRRDDQQDTASSTHSRMISMRRSPAPWRCPPRRWHRDRRASPAAGPKRAGSAC